ADCGRKAALQYLRLDIFKNFQLFLTYFALRHNILRTLVNYDNNILTQGFSKIKHLLRKYVRFFEENLLTKHVFVYYTVNTEQQFDSLKTPCEVYLHTSW